MFRTRLIAAVLVCAVGSACLAQTPGPGPKPGSVAVIGGWSGASPVAGPSPVPATSIVYSVWNTADQHAGADLIITNGDKTVSHAANGTPAFVRSTTCKTKGSGDKLQFELTAGTINSNTGTSAFGVGLAKTTANPPWWPADADEVIYQDGTGGSGSAWIAGNATATMYQPGLPVLLSNQTITVRWDTGGNTLSVNVNGAGWSSPLDVSSLNSGDYCIVYYNGESGDQFTLNPGSSAFAVALSSGYVAWDH